MGFARWLFESQDLFALDPVDVLRTGTPDARAMMDADRSRLAIYSPGPFDLEVDLDLTGWGVTAFDLAERRTFWPTVEPGRPSLLVQPRVNADVLILAERP
jgi:hypothetical protein